METTAVIRRRALKTHFDAVVYFFTKFDTDMISDLLADDCTYQDMSKHRFVRKLGDLFQDLQRLGDTKLLAMVDDTPLPIDGSYGVTFEGNNTALFIEVVFEVDEIGFITDIYEVEETVFEEETFTIRQRVFIAKSVDDIEEELEW